MALLKVKLLRPLDGHDEGAVRAFDAIDAERLAGYGAVQILGPAKAAHVRTKKAKAVADVTLTKPSSAQRRASAASTATAKRTKR